MIAVIFEVEVKLEEREEYLLTAATLRQELERQDGFISIERFASLNQENKMLSLSFWESDEAFKNWRHHPDHLLAQEKGKRQLFSRYKMRVAEVIREANHG